MNVRLRHSMTWTAGIWYADRMQMNQYLLNLSMITNSHDPENHNTAFERLKYFVYTQMDSTIYINADHVEQCGLFAQAGLSVTTLPGEPVDQLIGLMLYYKLNAIMEDRILVEETEISSTLGENMIYLHSENENTDIPEYPDWWMSPDPSHCDVNMLGTGKVVAMPDRAWRDLSLAWPTLNDSEQTGNIVVFDTFKNNEPK
jgi:hypothetical protein